MRKERILIALTAALGLIALVLYAYKVSLLGPSTDFSVYYRAAERLKGFRFNEIYTLLDGPCPFRYAPFFLPFFRPLAELTFERAQLAWFFVQFFCFLWAFVFLHRTLKLIAKTEQPYKTPLWITCAAALFVLRFCLDCFMIGQVSSVILCALSVSLWAWTSQRLSLAGMALAVPAAFKIGPGILFFLFFGIPGSRKLRPIWGALSGLLFLMAVFWAMLLLLDAPSGTGLSLWRGWFQIVREDSNYFDSSHYGSQSILSFLLRFAKAGFMTSNLAHTLHLVAGVVVSVATALFWFIRSPRNVLGRALFFSFGVFPYSWLMPETFKYSLTVLAFPAALLLMACTQEEYQPQKALRRFSLFALGFGVLTLSLAGKDIVGDTLFFGLQNASIPLLATLFLGAANLMWAHLLSTPRREQSPHQSFSKYLASAPPKTPLKFSLVVLRPCFPNRSVSSFFMKTYLESLQTELRHCLGEDFEILVANYGPVDSFHTALAQCVFSARGKNIGLLRIEHPPEPVFFTKAYQQLQDAKLIRASRRSPKTVIEVKVAELRRIYARFKRGLRWNRLLHRLFFRDSNSNEDLLSGNLVTTASLLRFALCTSHLPAPLELFFELELALCAQAHGLKQVDLPCKIIVPHEKSRSRMFGETFEQLACLPQIYWRNHRGLYGPFQKPQHVTCDDWGISKGVNDGIIELAKRGIVQRASALANGAHLNHRLTELLAIPGFEIGLHLNLTYARSLATEEFNPTPFRLLLKWLNPFGDREKLKRELAAEFEAQLSTLTTAGIEVRYLDGHHHAHLIPGVLEALAPLLKRHQISRIRLPYERRLWWSRKFPVNILASLATRPAHKFHRFGFSALPCFYPKLSDFSDLAQLRSKLGAHFQHEIIVHPALENDLAGLEFPDSYGEGRVREYEMLLGLPTGKL
ncbi:ChbG/HpnK family deacetylase [Bdellovibrionota bacterium FG-2]